MTRNIREAAAELGFTVRSIAPYLRREPGAPRNVPWYLVTLDCPCGRTKRLHVSRAASRHMRAALADHLRADGLLR